MAIRKSSTSGVPFGNTANRPANPTVGQTYYNGELGYQEIYTAAGWISASGGNDFNINLGGAYTTVTFSQSYGSGSYSIVSSNNDLTIDIYAYATDGSLAGYTATKSFTATQRFNKMVVIGGQQGDVLTFSYKTTFATTNTTSETTAGPFITAISPSAMPNINDTITITGGNFANDVQVAFTAAGYSSTAPKNIVRSSSSSLIVTRPDNFPVDFSPYTVTVTNPGISSPVGSNSHISSNSVTAGISPVWNTAATLPTFTRNVSYSTVLSATDSDTGGSITYSLVSGSLPTGLTLSSLTGAISGTPTAALAQTFTVRATDAGGNYVDRAFTIPNVGPVWSTGTTLPTFTKSSAYSTTVVATDDSGNNPTYSVISGSLPTGLTLSSAGVISGTPTSSTNATFTVRATDASGNTADRTFTMPNVGPTWVTSGTIQLSHNGTSQLSATDDGTLTYSVVSGTLPSGTTLNGSGLLTASTTNGSASITFRVTDDAGNTADRSLTITVVPFVFTSHTFTNAGASGRFGPTLANIQSAYSSQSWAQNTTFLSVPNQGIQRWFVPSTGNYTVTIAGGRGGTGNQAFGNGYVGTTTLSLTQGHLLDILVGHAGGGGSYAGGGGGGSFIFNTSTGGTLLAAAGGGGGGGWDTGSTNGSESPISGTGSYTGAAGTTDGNPGSVGTSYSNGSGGEGGANGSNAGVGGFGSGGGGGFGAGGSAGGRFGGPSTVSNQGGKGGGSYTSGTAFTNGGLNSGNGYITITKV